MVGLAVQKRKIKFRDNAIGPIPKLPGRANQTLIDHGLNDAEAFKHVEGGRMKGGGAKITRQIRA